MNPLNQIVETAKLWLKNPYGEAELPKIMREIKKRERRNRRMEYTAYKVACIRRWFSWRIDHIARQTWVKKDSRSIGMRVMMQLELPERIK